MLDDSGDDVEIFEKTPVKVVDCKTPGAKKSPFKKKSKRIVLDFYSTKTSRVKISQHGCNSIKRSNAWSEQCENYIDKRHYVITINLG